MLTEARIREEVQPVGRDRILAQRQRAKPFETERTDDRFSYRRKEESIAQQAALDGFYILCASMSAEDLTAEQAVTAYQSLSRVERVPVFLCLLAYYVAWER